MEEQVSLLEQDSFLNLLPQLPHWWEFCVLTTVVVCLVGAGHLIMRFWRDRNENVPLPATLILWVGMFAFYFAEVLLFYRLAPDTHKLGILAWCLIFWTVPVTYYTYAVVTSLANTTVDRVTSLGAAIEDPSEFAKARKLALRGDIDGAVAAYRDYKDHQEAALFEAARLLKSENRFAEAADMFQDVAQQFSTRLGVWAEATYQLAKLREVQLGEPREAMELLRRILNRAPETRFAQLAGSDLARLQVMDEDFLKALEGEGEDVAAQDPFYVKRKTEEEESAETVPAEPEKKPDYQHPIPAADPFFRPAPGAESEDAETKPAKKRIALHRGQAD